MRRYQHGYLTDQREHEGPLPDWRCCSAEDSGQQGSPGRTQAGSQPLKNKC